MNEDSTLIFWVFDSFKPNWATDLFWAVWEFHKVHVLQDFWSSSAQNSKDGLLLREDSFFWWDASFAPRWDAQFSTRDHHWTRNIYDEGLEFTATDLWTADIGKIPASTSWYKFEGLLNSDACDTCKDFCCPSQEPSLFLISGCSGNFRRSCAALSFRTCDLKVVVAGMLGMSKRSGWLGDLVLADPTPGRGFVTYLESNMKTQSALRRLALKLSCITVSLCRVWVDWVDCLTSDAIFLHFSARGMISEAMRWWDDEKLMMLRCHRRWSVSSFWEESKPRVDGWLQFYIRFRGVLGPWNVRTRISKPWTMDKTPWQNCWVAFCQKQSFVVCKIS